MPPHNGHKRKVEGMRVVTREQLFGVDRDRNLAQGLRETAWYRNRPKYEFKAAAAVSWLLPGKEVVAAFATVSASIVWGICGQTGDMEEAQVKKVFGST